MKKYQFDASSTLIKNIRFSFKRHLFECVKRGTNGTSTYEVNVMEGNHAALLVQWFTEKGIALLEITA